MANNYQLPPTITINLRATKLRAARKLTKTFQGVKKCSDLACCSLDYKLILNSASKLKGINLNINVS